MFFIYSKTVDGRQILERSKKSIFYIDKKNINIYNYVYIAISAILLHLVLFVKFYYKNWDKTITKEFNEMKNNLSYKTGVINKLEFLIKQIFVNIIGIFGMFLIYFFKVGISVIISSFVVNSFSKLFQQGSAKNVGLKAILTMIVAFFSIRLCMSFFFFLFAPNLGKEGPYTSASKDDHLKNGKFWLYLKEFTIGFGASIFQLILEPSFESFIGTLELITLAMTLFVGYKIYNVMYTPKTKTIRSSFKCLNFFYDRYNEHIPDGFSTEENFGQDILIFPFV